MAYLSFTTVVFFWFVCIFVPMKCCIFGLLQNFLLLVSFVALWEGRQKAINVLSINFFGLSENYIFKNAKIPCFGRIWGGK